MRYPSAVDLQYFLEVASRGSMSRAADSLGLRQSTLSTAIKRVEFSLGSTLFLRSKTGAQLTSEGKVLLDEAKNFQRLWTDIQTRVKASKTLIAGRYGIGCHPSAGLIVLPPVIKRLTEDHPRISVDVFTNYSGSVIEEVRDRRLDFGLSASPNVSLDIDSLPIMSAEIGLWALKGLEISPDHPLIYDPQMLGLTSILKKIQSSRMAFTKLMPVGDLEMVAEFSRAGVGVGILPDVVALRHKAIQLVNIQKGLFYKSPLRLYFLPDTLKSPGATAVIEAFKSCFKKPRA